MSLNTYNGDGYRVEKTVNGAITRYLYEYDKVVLELDGAGNQTGRNVYGTNLLMRSADGTTYYYMYNGHADVTALLKPDGTIAATYYYDAFGNIIDTTGAASNTITFAGYQYDKETGLYYLNARMYDPKTARFLQEDTYTGDRNDPLSLNLYTYCHNEPLMYWDPTGHMVNGQQQAMEISAKIKANSRKKYKNVIDKYKVFFKVFDEYDVDYTNTEEYSEYTKIKNSSDSASSTYKSIDLKGYSTQQDGMALNKAYTNYNKYIREATANDSYRNAMNTLMDKMYAASPYDSINNHLIREKFQQLKDIEICGETGNADPAIINNAKALLLEENSSAYADYHIMTTGRLQQAYELSSYGLSQIVIGKYYSGNVGVDRGHSDEKFRGFDFSGLDKRKNEVGKVRRYQPPEGFLQTFADKGTPEVGSGINRTEALNKAKDWAEVPRSQQASRQWSVGDDITKKGANYKNYEYSDNPTHHGRYYEYETPQGKKVVVDHINDVEQGLHTHAGRVPDNGDIFMYDFKKPGNKYYPINKDTNHHILYQK